MPTKVSSEKRTLSLFLLIAYLDLKTSMAQNCLFIPILSVKMIVCDGPKDIVTQSRGWCRNNFINT